MKRLTIALAAIGLTASCGAFAAYPANTDPTMVAVPQLPGGLVVGLTGVYMQPSASNGDLNWGSLVTGTSATSTTTTVEQIDPSWTFGGGGNIGYIFPGTGNDVNLSYFHINSQDSDNLAISGITLTGADTQFIDPVNSGLPMDTTNNSARDSLDQIDLTFGQFINVGCRLVLHPFAGARFANITRDITSNYSGFFTVPGVLSESAVQSIEEESNYTGVGPLAGFDVSYYVWNGVGVVGHFDGGLLVGNINSSTDSTTNGTLVTEAAATDFSLVDNNSAENTRRIVPVVDAALGLDYTWLFNNADNSDLTLEVGYKVTNYFNAIDRVYVDTTTVSSSDLGISGVYATLTLHV